MVTNLLMRNGKTYIVDNKGVRKPYIIENNYADEFKKTLGNNFSIHLPYECEFCGCNFLKSKELKDHQTIHKIKYDENGCNIK